MKAKLFNGTEWIEFETTEAHDAYVKSIIQEQPKVRTVEQDMEYGKQVILEYLRENKLLDITTSQSLNQLQKFAPIKGLLEVGALGAARDLISLVEVDEILTQARKDKYIQMLNDFLQ